MIKRYAILLTLCIIALAGDLSAWAAVKGPVWEVVTVVDASPQLAESETIQVDTRDGYIYITVDRPTQVEVYTILGQLVTRRKLQAGTTRLQLANRGIYILKSGATTRRVNL